ncbi:hypothetical protein, variant [Sphaeroforma arctica JP610]|uniref:Spherulation-specific family 4 n=1 Tax=Sphaeroforma arctica JP610 TaxID=667725 RepID=A0A0L0GGZ1_9EUKA|nr:hypothetical protein, variant [Sphaeroforma arctica JP610]KNC87588.1 hypothetical protein, variant [Sphaeroforma arctica JP610]|eukprot:XP_014161490.1 hypothetical protein, variant [Sphaeroforma arctica JP610]
MFKKFTRRKVRDEVSNHKITIVIPLYIYPSIQEGSEWHRLAQSSSKVDIVAIINPNSGPGDALNSDYVAGVAMLRDAGIEIFGYVHTQYGQRDKDLVSSEIKAFSEWYAVDGIFLDEGSSEHHIVSYYNSLNTYIKEFHVPDSPRMKSVILNTGVEPHDSYYDACDNLVTCENYWKDFQQAHLSGAREKSLALLHTCPTAKDMTKAVKKAAASEVWF